MLTIASLNQLLGKLILSDRVASSDRLDHIQAYIRAHYSDEGATLDRVGLREILSRLKPAETVTETDLMVEWMRYAHFIDLLSEAIANAFQEGEDVLMGELYRELYSEIPNKKWLQEIVNRYWMRDEKKLSPETMGNPAYRIQYQMLYELNQAHLLMASIKFVDLAMKIEFLEIHVHWLYDSFDKLFCMLKELQYFNLETHKKFLNAIGKEKLAIYINTPELLASVIELCPVIMTDDYLSDELFTGYMHIQDNMSGLAFLILKASEKGYEDNNKEVILVQAALLRRIWRCTPEIFSVFLSNFLESPYFLHHKYLPILVAACAQDLKSLSLLLTYNKVDIVQWAEQAMLLGMSTHTSPDCFKKIIDSAPLLFYGVNESMDDETLLACIEREAGFKMAALSSELRVGYAQQIREARRQLDRSQAVFCMTYCDDPPSEMSDDQIKECFKCTFDFSSSPDGELRLGYERKQLVNALINRLIPLDSKYLSMTISINGELKTLISFMDEEEGRACNYLGAAKHFGVERGKGVDIRVVRLIAVDAGAVGMFRAPDASAVSGVPEGTHRLGCEN